MLEEKSVSSEELNEENLERPRGYKTFCRAFGVFQAGLMGVMGYYYFTKVSPEYNKIVNYLNDISQIVPYNINNFLDIFGYLGDSSVVALGTIVMFDGISDIIKGEHHSGMEKLEKISSKVSFINKLKNKKRGKTQND